MGYAGQNFPSFIFPSIIGRPIIRAEEVSADCASTVILKASECITLIEEKISSVTLRNIDWWIRWDTHTT